jgi:rhomboid protease GluP
VPPPRAAEQVAEFQRRLVELTPRVYVTPALVALNVGVYLLMVARGVSFINPTGEHLIAWGADYGPRTVSGEWWRLLTCVFVHVGIIHLALNMWVLADGGPLVERLLGHAGFAVLYLVSGLGASIASVWWNPLGISAGASGAIFGIYGALISSMLLRHDSIPLEALTRLRNSGITFLAYNLVFGLIVPRIDMGAHVGGLVTGFLCGAVLSHRLTPEAASRRLVRSMAVGTGAALVLGAAAWALPRDLPDIPAIIDGMAKAEQQAIDTYNAAVRRQEKGELTDAELGEIIQRDVVPPLRAECERLAGLKAAPPKSRELLAVCLEYMKTRAESYELLAQSLREGDERKGALWHRKRAAADALVPRIKALLKQSR